MTRQITLLAPSTSSDAMALHRAARQARARMLGDYIGRLAPRFYRFDDLADGESHANLDLPALCPLPRSNWANHKA